MMNKLYRMTDKELAAYFRCLSEEKRSAFSKTRLVGIGMIIVLTVLILSVVMVVRCRAEVVDVETLATAIYHAEGGASTRHPYGILQKYRHTTPRQACINTIRHALRDWNGRGDFIRFLGNRYCPVGASNDPTGLNKNWIRNVSRIYNRMKEARRG